jgi:glutamyl-tRNA synthetase
MSVAVRFAPSPTGYLHVGNARIALVNWLYARARSGTFLLRLDDTDVGRSKAEFAEAIEEDLRWLGLNWDRIEHQSQHMADYAQAADRLKATGRLYACYETPEELDQKRRLQAARHLPPVYDRAALKLTAPERAAHEAAGRKPHWRFMLEHRRVAWNDRVHGALDIDAGSLSDPVAVRGDGVPLYTFCSVVDDIAFGITDVIRGEDHITNTAAQIQIFAALGAAPPAFSHLSLLTGAAGEGLSKREGSLSLRDMRASGIEAMALNSLLARLGSADAIEPKVSLNDLTAGFDVARFGRAPAKFDLAELKHLNSRVLHLMDFAAVAARLPHGAREDFWLAVRGNIATLDEAAAWWRVVAAPLQPVIEDKELAGQAARMLPPGPFDSGTWKTWTAAVKDATGRKGKALFHPLRLALTGREHGPEMHNLLPLIGPERARARLLGETA